MCAKSLFNGPCGGTNQGSCEIDESQPCAWHQIWERLTLQGRLEAIMEIHSARDHMGQVPRRVVQPGYEETEEK